MTGFLELTIIVMTLFLLRMSKQIVNLRRENAILRKQLEEAVAELEKYQTKDKSSLKYLVGRLIDLGTPGLVLLVVVSSSPFTGAAAITAGLAAIGGSLGMLGGIGVLILLPSTIRFVREKGLRKIAKPVIEGLIEKGRSKDDIRREAAKLSKLIPRTSRRVLVEVVDGELGDSTKKAAV
jgi:hypothetical protein